MKCDEFIKLIDGYVDGELNESECASIAEHARVCPDCGRELKRAEQIRLLLSNIDDDIVPPLPAQAAWRGAVKAEANKNKIRRIYRVCAAAAACLVALVGVTAGIKYLGKDSGNDAVKTSNDNFMYIAVDGDNDAMTAEPTMSAAEVSETIKLITEHADSDAMNVIELIEEFNGKVTEKDMLGNQAYLEAIMPNVDIAPFIEALKLIGEVNDITLPSGDPDNTTTISIEIVEP